MNNEENKEYNNLRRKASRKNESEEQSRIWKQKVAEAMAKRRKLENEEEKKKRNEANKMALSSKRDNETTEEKNLRNAAKAKANATKRSCTVSDIRFDGRNAKKVFDEEQIVLELKDTDDSIGKMDVVCKFAMHGSGR